MLVVCPKCFTQYAVSDEIKVPEGQKFHCFACNHYFALQSGAQNGFYGDSHEAENDEIPTVSSVMNAQESESLPVEPTVSESPAPTVENVQTVPENESNRQSDSQPKTVYEEPLALLAKEKPQLSDRLDSLPEAFQPVTKAKKTSFISAVFWLIVACGICYGAIVLLKKNPMYETIETVIGMALDKHSLTDENTIQPKQKQPVQPQRGVATPEKTAPFFIETPVVPQKNAAALQKTIAQELKNEPLVREEMIAAETKLQKEGVPLSAMAESAMQERFEEQAVKKEEEALKTALAKAASDQELAAVEYEKERFMAEEAKVRAQTQAQLNASLDDEGARMDRDNESQEAIQVTNPTRIMLNEMHQQAQPMPNQMQAAPMNNARPPYAAERNMMPQPTPAYRPQSVPSRPQAGVVPQNTQPAPMSAPQQGDAQSEKLSPADANRILRIHSVSYELAPNEVGVMRLMIKGIIANTELQKVVIPELKAVVYNQEDMVVARKRIILAQPEIEGNSVQAFFSSVVPAPEQISHVEVLFDE